MSRVLEPPNAYPLSAYALELAYIVWPLMTSMNESMMKADRRGRLRYTPEQKQTMVAVYRASGLSAPRFAAHHGVNVQTLDTCIKKDKQSPASATPDSSSFRCFSLIPALIE
jgi:hypothetical protein